MSTINSYGTSGSAPKGSSDNPYTMEEFESLWNSEIWPGGYVTGLGWVKPNAIVISSFLSSGHGHIWLSGQSFSFPDNWPDNDEDDGGGSGDDSNGNSPSDGNGDFGGEGNGSSGGGYGDSSIIDNSGNSGEIIGSTKWDDLLRELASITGTSVSVYTTNKYYQNPFTKTEIWVTQQGKLYDSSVLMPRSNGKYIQGVQGIRLSKATAQESVVGLNSLAKGLGLGFALFDAIQAINEQSIERGITALRETLSAFYLPYALADLYISSVYDAYVRLNNGTATYSDIMMLTTGYPTSAVYTGSYQYYYQLQQYNQHLNNP